MTKSSKPRMLNIRTYQVGFGDCYLLTFHYTEGEKRHVLIDFGSTGQPEKYGDRLMLRVAENIRDYCEGKLHAVVATHRHKDHISGFATNSDGKGPGDIIRSCKPDVVIQPWTEDPKAQPRSKGAKGTTADKNKGFTASLLNMHAVSEVVLLEAQRLQRRISQGLHQQLSFLGEDNLTNRSAVENLMTMGEKNYYVYYGSKSGLETVLPGVNTRVLGPPTLAQSSSVTKQRSRDSEEFWHLQAAAGGLSTKLVADKSTIFPEADVYSDTFTPPHARWFLRRVRAARGEQLLELVRVLDKVMNNTSIILLFETGGKKFLFPGDAQIENWQYALNNPKDRALLKSVNLYKVGHHGSLNATPKSLWNLFDNRSEKKSEPNRLQTLVSTMAGKHGSIDRGTEVPRIKLVQELKSKSEYFSTQKLAEQNKLFEDFPIPL